MSDTYKIKKQIHGLSSVNKAIVDKFRNKHFIRACPVWSKTHTVLFRNREVLDIRKSILFGLNKAYSSKKDIWTS